MPRSKRDKKISLTKTKKKGMELKEKLYEEIRKSVDQYDRIFTFSVQNMRNNKLKDIRQEWSSSRFFFGKNKIMALALGRSESDSYAENLYKISKKMHGQMGLLFTNLAEEEVLDWFREYCEDDYARSGNKATHTVYIEAGPMKAFPHSMEPQLRQIGMPTSLEKGVVTLLKNYKVCQKDDILTPEQARILKLFDYKMAQFHLTMESMWTKDTHKFNKCPRSVPEKTASGGTLYIKPKQSADDYENELREVLTEQMNDGDDGMDTDDDEDVKS